MDDLEEFGEASGGWLPCKKVLESRERLAGLVVCRECAIVDSAIGVCRRDKAGFAHLLEIGTCDAEADVKFLCNLNDAGELGLALDKQPQEVDAHGIVERRADVAEFVLLVSHGQPLRYELFSPFV